MHRDISQTSEVPAAPYAAPVASFAHVAWQTGEPIHLPIGDLSARGQASPQVRRPERAAALGDQAAQAGAIAQAIVQALAQVLQGMAPSVEQLPELLEEISSAALVAANLRLADHGIALLELNVASWSLASVTDR